MKCLFLFRAENIPHLLVGIQPTVKEAVLFVDNYLYDALSLTALPQPHVGVQTDSPVQTPPRDTIGGRFDLSIGVREQSGFNPIIPRNVF